MERPCRRANSSSRPRTICMMFGARPGDSAGSAFVFGLAARLPQRRREVPAVVDEARDDAPLGLDARAARGHGAPRDDPDAARAVVQLVRALAEQALAVGHCPLDGDLLVVVAPRVAIYLIDARLGEGDGRRRAREYKAE